MLLETARLALVAIWRNALRSLLTLLGVTIGVASPRSYFPFGGARDSFFGDLKVHGRDAFEFYTDKKVTISRWF